MAKYKLQKSGVLREDGVFICEDSKNPDWVEYYNWLSLGNTPDNEYTLEQLIEDKKNIVDNNTDAILGNGFMWNNIRFKADLEHQMTYKTAAEMIINGVMPEKKIKGNDNNFITLNSTNAAEFLMTGLGFVDSVLSDGWALKYGGIMSDATVIETGVGDMTYEQLTAFEDPRV